MFTYRALFFLKELPRTFAVFLVGNLSLGHLIDLSNTYDAPSVSTSHLHWSFEFTSVQVSDSSLLVSNFYLICLSILVKSSTVRILERRFSLNHLPTYSISVSVRCACLPINGILCDYCYSFFTTRKFTYVINIHFDTLRWHSYCSISTKELLEYEVHY